MDECSWTWLLGLDSASDNSLSEIVDTLHALPCWLHDLLKPHVTRLVVCDPRKNARFPFQLTHNRRFTQYKRRPLCCRLWLFVSPPTERSAVMSQDKYIGMDVHQATISVAVLDSRGKFIMESILETKAATILEFLQGLHGSLSVTFEEGTSAAWLHDLLKPHVTRLVVCDPRKNALLKDGSKSDRIDARKLAELLP